MAGIGQRYSSDNVPWSASHSQFGMGRTVPESNKPFSPFMAPEKRVGSSFVGDFSLPNGAGQSISSRSSNYLHQVDDQNGPSSNLLSAFANKRPPLSSDAGNSYSSMSQQLKSMNNPGSVRYPANGTLLDPSEFPPIQQSGGNKGQSNSSSSQLRNFMLSQQQPMVATAVVNSAVPSQFKSSESSSAFHSPPEFSIENDFPALPGSSQATVQSRSQPHTPQPPITCNGGSNYSTQVPRNMISDQYGLLGLLKLLHVGESHHLLAPGIDLLSLSINCQTQGELYPTFLSPCHETCMGRPQDLDYPVPQEYLIHHKIAHDLVDPPTGKLTENTLFWLFYNCCQEEVQLVAAKELLNQKWHYHKKEQVWFLPSMQQGGNNGSMVTTYWDPIAAQRSQREMVVNYATDVDDFPNQYRTTSGLLSASINMTGGGVSMGPSGSYNMFQQQGQQSNGKQFKTQSSIPQGMFAGPTPQQQPVSIANRAPVGLVPNGGLMHVSASSPSLMNQGQRGSGGGNNGMPNGLVDSVASMMLQEKFLKSAAAGESGKSASAAPNNTSMG